MLTRDAISLLSANQWNAREVCAMAMRLLDIADLVPGEGDVVERVRILLSEFAEARKWLTVQFSGSPHEAHEMPVSQLAKRLDEQLRRAEQERDEARAGWAKASAEKVSLLAAITGLAELADEARMEWRYPPPTVANKEQRDEWDRRRCELRDVAPISGELP